MISNQAADVVIIGSGISALVAAERLSKDKNVMIITKSKKEHSNSNKAQGGVAAAVSRNDDWKNHFQDTITAGNYHNIEQSVQTLVQKGPELLKAMIAQGMNFDRDSNGKIKLGQEGAHGMRRILHAGGDATGKALIQFLLNRLKENSNVQIIEDALAVDLIIVSNRCFGIKMKTSSGFEHILTKDTILAAGGSGGLYSFSSNDPTVTGDGIALAYRAGANLVDLEFVQFHPTLLYVNGAVQGLISEAVRGEGAVLLTKDGRPLMKGIHPQKDLAPRDIVSRAIHHAVLQGEQIFLDISMVENFQRRFPTITDLCCQSGIDVKKGRIPVVPGAHFHMGGVEVNQQGETSVEHLYAIGEVACTGVHGANRLASNSLLEGIVFANELANYLLSKPASANPLGIPSLIIDNAITPPKRWPAKEEIKEVMMKYVGIVRNEQGLLFAKNWFEQYLPNNSKYHQLPSRLTDEEISTFNMLQAGWLITTSALMREESRGGHYRSDFSEEQSAWMKRRIVRNRIVPSQCITHP